MKAARASVPVDSASPSQEAKALSIDDIKKEVEKLHLRSHRTIRSAIFGRLADPALDGEVFTAKIRDEARRLRVVAAAGELDLRRKLGLEGESADGAASVYIVPFARHLPRDVEAVFAGGRVVEPRIDSLVPRRFGARSGTPRLLGSKLVTLVQREGMRAYASGDAPVIDLDDAWLLFLRNRLGRDGLETEAQLFAATLLDRDERGPAAAKQLDAVPGAREELYAVLDRRMGSSAPHILAAWLTGTSVDLAATAVVGEATRPTLMEGRGTSYSVLAGVLETHVIQAERHPLRAVREKEKAAGLAKACIDLSYLVPLMWQKLPDSSGDALRRAILGAAERLLGAEHVRPLAQSSNRLPFVFEHRCDAFVDAINKALDAEGPAAVSVALDALDQAAFELLSHEAARADGSLEEQVEMASRLAAFLGEPLARGAATQPESADGPLADVISLARFQASAGGYVDWARQTVRHEGAGRLGRGLARLVAQADAARDALDARFAQAYTRLVDKRGERGAMRGSVRVDGARAELLLIEDALARLGLDLVEQSGDLRLLILCMDGMSHANMAELWSSIARTSFVPVSRGPRLPVLAYVPTITKLSRSALFAGRPMASGESLDTGRDEERLKQHPTLRRLGETPIVLLKGHIVGEGGGLSDDAHRVVRGDQRVVGVVVNAIDDQLKGSAQLRVLLTTEHIRPLRALLQAAEITGRLVLLVSDHGNISSQRFVGAAARPDERRELEGAERGARHRTLAASEAAAVDEIELPAGALAGAKGLDRVAVAVRESVRYTSVLHAGEHGGASLAEAIAPATLLAPRGLLPDLYALGVYEAPLEPPSFWSRDRAARASAEALPAPAEAPRSALEPAPKKPGQGVLPFDSGVGAASEAASGAASGAAPKLAQELFASQLFRAQIQAIAEVDRPGIKEAITLLIRHGGRMTWDRFAVAMKITTAGSPTARVPGFVSRIERVLNFDQDPVLAMDSKGKSVTLDEPLLRTIFLEDADG